ncbi:S1 RNA-binding domain-containing protein [Modicisalibacter tunisiensis]|uniref:RNA-binding protein n=1 Tax=Modicisalibacter tunisiensis TaxID=390637 RepID=A0ABS7WW55_9GAMM|nr:S1-like domain-containing RNA-binding protein [Modicisalibacter tunisiensis]MBZ9566837.1 RNA-binding protein [Modicisalibacter tunisiensis]
MSRRAPSRPPSAAADTPRHADADSRAPHPAIGEVAWLRVVSVNDSGAFLDWGRPKDLLLPFGEQVGRPEAGRHVLVKINVDERSRPVASMRLNRFIADTGDDLAPGDAVTLVVADRTPLGVKAVVEHRVWGLLYQDDLPRALRRGERLDGYVRRVREDGRLDLSLAPLGGARRDQARERVLAALDEGDGFLALTDKSPAAVVKARLGVSKSAFKEAIGGLYKQRRIRLEADGIHRVDDGTPSGDAR